MLRRTLNLGILAHVDAGKTTLTERLLYAAGVIGAPGSVDAGTTQTDSLPLEQQRGITIKSAVVSFPLDGVTVNLIDTPGHPDFIAEVERVLAVLDGAVLVVSAVEGVQPQTRVLMRALERLRIPALVFVNKIDRAGADCGRVFSDIAERLTPAAVLLSSVAHEGTRAAFAARRDERDAAVAVEVVEVLAERDDDLLAAWVDADASVPSSRLRTALAAQSQAALVRPVLCGSALTGAGLDDLNAALVELLPAASGDLDGPVAGTVFKIERAAGGEKVAYARLFAGTLHVRDRVRYGREGEGKVTSIEVFDRGGAAQRSAVCAGQIAKIRGLAGVRIGDRVGDGAARGPQREFPPPTLESVVVPADPSAAYRLRVALEQLAEQDPLIDVRQDDERHEMTVSLYGEVQKEVLEATLADDYSVPVVFRETTPIYVERPARSGEAVEVLHAPSNPFLATIGLRIDPAADGSGIAFRLDVDPRVIPLYVYKTADAFRESMDGYVRDALRAGLLGWQVTDCTVTMTRCSYSVPDGPPSRRGPLSTAADFRKLTPIVLVQALEQAGTVVCEPTVRATLEAPADTIGALVAALVRLGAAVETPSLRASMATIEALMPAARADELQRQLSGLTRGEGVVDTAFAGYEPVSGEPPRRRRGLAER